MDKNINLESANVEEIFQKKLEDSMGLVKYQKIMEKAKEPNGVKDPKFQKMFNGFYKVIRNPEWRKAYYECFAKYMKNGNATFDNIIDDIYSSTKCVEPSFASKMLATINSEKPIWDKFVRNNIGIKWDNKKDATDEGEKARLEEAKELYKTIEDCYEKFIHSKNGQECITIFDNMFPNYTWISNVKKIDFILWNDRYRDEEENKKAKNKDN